MHLCWLSWNQQAYYQKPLSFTKNDDFFINFKVLIVSQNSIYVRGTTNFVFIIMVFERPPFVHVTVITSSWSCHLVFRDLMNRVCKRHLDKFVIVFINNILIYSKSKSDNEKHLHLILDLLKKEQLYAKFFKCEFWLKKSLILVPRCQRKGYSCRSRQDEGRFIFPCLHPGPVSFALDRFLFRG